MSTIQCKKCGKRIIQKEKVCPHCGESVPHSIATTPLKSSKLKKTMERYKQIREEQPRQDENLTACKACGEKISKNAETCPHCGEPVPKKKKTSMWTWLLILLFIGYVVGEVDKGKTTTTVSSSSHTKKSKPKKERRNTLRGGYYACTSEALFDEMISATVNKDKLAIGHLLTKGCVLTKKGVKMSIIDMGMWGTAKIRAYSGNESIILYTNTENVYY